MARKKKEKLTVVPEPNGLRLSEDDAQGLRNRHGTMLAQEARALVEARLAEMAKESYNSFMGELRVRYELTDDDEIDLGTGDISKSEAADG